MILKRNLMQIPKLFHRVFYGSTAFGRCIPDDLTIVAIFVAALVESSTYQEMNFKYNVY